MCNLSGQSSLNSSFQTERILYCFPCRPITQLATSPKLSLFSRVLEAEEDKEASFVVLAQRTQNDCLVQL